MDYILRGNDKDVANVLKEQRIRIGRGVVSFTPISECGLVTEEDARKTLECMLTEKDAKIGEPLESLENRIIKRAFDIVCSGVFLITVFPFVYIFFGIAIKLSSPGPVFFKQKRSGEDGREFWCYKFRSMKVNTQCDTLQATENDPRKTRIGEIMRKTSVDELPQFINVLKGDMSIVGPRPHMLKHTEEYSNLINKFMVRHFVKPGITGWAQVTGYRGETKELVKFLYVAVSYCL